ncbi:NME5 [Bugula neritina]|uniref:NME5 n=1 Tax=Bugula neritina TaxID=10212 RepID=A0A7J7IYV2_BUGNE|nr:NME5 [Bugula neritina]
MWILIFCTCFILLFTDIDFFALRTVNSCSLANDWCLFLLSDSRVQLTPEQASDFYAEHYGKLFFPSLVAYISSGPIIALALAREKAIAHWRDLIGPTNTLKARQTHPDCLRAIYGTDDQRNACMGVTHSPVQKERSDSSSLTAS